MALTKFEEFIVIWFEEPVGSDDLNGLRQVRDRAPSAMEIGMSFVIVRAGAFGGASLQWQTFFDGLSHIVNRCMLTQLCDLPIVSQLLQSQPLSDPAFHSQTCSDLLFGKQKYLKHKMIAFFGSPAHAGLSHQNKACHQNCFECNTGV
jgi:hypothetical protein